MKGEVDIQQIMFVPPILPVDLRNNANKNFQALFEIIPRWQCLTGKEFVKPDHSELYTQVSPWGDGNKETAELKFLQLLYSRTKCLSIQTYLSPKHE